MLPGMASPVRLNVKTVVAIVVIAALTNVAMGHLAASRAAGA